MVDRFTDSSSDNPMVSMPTIAVDRNTEGGDKLSVSSVKTQCRSPEAKVRRNQRGHKKMAQKQKQFHLSRRIETPWTLINVKTFLRQQHIKFARIPPIYKHRLRIQFNNPADLKLAEETLPEDAFSQQAFSLLLI